MDIEDRDEELVRAVRNAPEGDLRAFEALMETYQKRILADCQHLTRDPNNAEDLAQEVFVKAYFSLAGFEGRSTFRHWLQRIKVNHCLNHLKKRQNRSAVSIDEETVESRDELRVAPTAEETLRGEEKRQRIDAILASMPDSLRMPLIMRDMDELSYEEIAAALGLGLSAVKMRIKRGREYFRSMYAGSPGGLA